MSINTVGVLQGAIEDVDIGAGQLSARLVVTNVGAECVLDGYCALQLLGGDGAPLPTNAQWDLPPSPAPVRLPTGGRAAVDLRWSDMPGIGDQSEGPCQPIPAMLQVTPQGAAAPFEVTWSQGPVCERGLIHMSAFYPA